jgi:hypothetical protein
MHLEAACFERPQSLSVFQHDPYLFALYHFLPHHPFSVVQRFFLAAHHDLSATCLSPWQN